MSSVATSALARIKVLVKHNYFNLFFHLVNAFIQSVFQVGTNPNQA